MRWSATPSRPRRSSRSSSRERPSRSPRLGSWGRRGAPSEHPATRLPNRRAAGRATQLRMPSSAPRAGAQPRLVTVLGTAGVGKSRLANGVAQMGRQGNRPPRPLSPIRRGDHVLADGRGGPGRRPGVSDDGLARSGARADQGPTGAGREEGTLVMRGRHPARGLGLSGAQAQPGRGLLGDPQAARGAGGRAPSDVALLDDIHWANRDVPRPDRVPGGVQHRGAPILIGGRWHGSSCSSCDPN